MVLAKIGGKGGEGLLDMIHSPHVTCGNTSLTIANTDINIDGDIVLIKTKHRTGESLLLLGTVCVWDIPSVLGVGKLSPCAGLGACTGSLSATVKD